MTLPGQVFIIDDDQDDLELMGEAMEKLDIKNSYQFFQNAREALEKISIQGERPYLILCDLNLRGMTALEFKNALTKTHVLVA